MNIQNKTAILLFAKFSPDFCKLFKKNFQKKIVSD